MWTFARFRNLRKVIRRGRSTCRANFPPETRLLIGCQVGGRSAQAAQVLASAGYTDVASVLRGE